MERLTKLGEVVSAMLARPDIAETIIQLKSDVKNSPEPFVWAVLDLTPIAERLPKDIRSGWIFVLKKETWSGAHFHPNSVQHMVVIEGRGRSSIGGVSGTMSPMETDQPIETDWFVIEAGAPHEFYPVENDMVVMSFHTCDAAALLEISAADGRSRTYAV